MDDFDNAPRWPAFRSACIEAGVIPGTWYTHGWNLWRTPQDAFFTIGEDESVEDRRGVVSSIPALDPDMPKAIVSNVWVIKRSDGTTNIEATRETTKPIVDAGFECITEVYARTDDGQPTGHTPDRLAFTAVRDLGFAESRVQPGFGIFGGASSAFYDQWRDCAAWSDYVVEHTLP